MTEPLIALRDAAARFANGESDWRDLWAALFENIVELSRDEPLAGDLFLAFEEWENSVGDKRIANLEAVRDIARRLAQGS